MRYLESGSKFQQYVYLGQREKDISEQGVVKQGTRIDNNRKGGSIMATNFRISVHRNSDNLHMKLQGDFDGSSAFELLNTLGKKTNGANKVFVHTNGLKEIHPFGSQVFRGHSDILRGLCHRFVFTGEYGSRIALKGSLVL